MSNAIDSKVVEMKFDNRDFESNVKNSISTLDKLKQSLNFKGSVKGLNAIDDASKKVNFDGMASGIEKVRVGFSAMEVAGMTVISNLTTQAMQLSSSLANMFVFDPPKSGFAEYEEYMGSIQTIQAGTGASIKEINSYLDELNTYADKTIYSFSDMTANIGKFTNAGVDLRTAVKAIQGISNEAAVSGANTEMASRAMYNFAQALSAGYVKLIDWKSIENANMATKEFKQQLIDTAVQLGTVIEKEGQYESVTTDANGNVSDLFDSTKNFNDSLSSQWMTTEVLTTTLGRYSDETTDIGKKAFAAAQDVRTFSMMMDTLTEAVGSGWTATWRMLVGDFDDAKNFWTEMTNFFSDIIQKSADARNNLLEGALTDPVAGLESKLNEAGISIDDFQAKLIEVGTSRGLNLSKAIEESGSLSQAMKDGRITTTNVIDTLDAFANETSHVVDQTDELNEKLNYFQQVVDDVWYGKYKNAPERYQLLADAGYDYAKVQELVNKTVDGHRLTLEDLGEEQMKAIGYTDEEIAKFKELSNQAHTSGTTLNEFVNNLQRQKNGRDLLIETVQTVRNSVVNLAGAVKTAWTETFGSFTSTMLYNIIQKLHDLAEAMKVDEDRADKLKRIFKGVLAPVKALATIIQRVLSAAFKQLGKTMDNFNIDILDVLANIGDTVVAFSEWVTSADAMNDVTDKLQNGLEWLKQKGTEFLDWLKSLPLVGDIIKSLEGTIGTFADKVKAALASIKGADKVTDAFDGIGDKIKGEIEQGLTAITDGTIFDDVIQAILNAKDKIAEILSQLVQTIVNAGNDFMNGAKDFDYGPLMTFAAGFGIIAGLYKFNKAIQGFAGMVDTLMGPVAAFTNLINAAKKVVTGFSGLMKAAKQWTQAGAILTVALAVVTICGAIGLLAQIPLDQLLPVAGIVAGICAVLIGMLAALAKLGKVADKNSKMFVTMSVMIGTFALALVAMVGAIAILGNMDTGTMLQGIGGLVGIIALLSTIILAVLGLTKLFQGGDSQVAMVKQIGRFMMELGVAFVLIGAAVAIIGAVPVDGFNRAAQMLAYVGIFIGGIIALVGIIGKASGISGSQIYGIGNLFTAVGVMMLSISAALAIMSLVPEDGFDRGVKLFDRAMAFVLVLTGIAAFAPKGQAAAKGVGTLMVGVGVAMLSMAASMKIVAGMSVEDLEKGLRVVDWLKAFVIQLMIAATIMSKVGGNSIAPIMLGLVGSAVAVALLAGTVALVGMVPTETLAKGTVVVGFLALFIAGMGLAFKGVGADTYKSILAAAGAVAILAVLVAAVSYMSWDTALQGIAKLGLMVIGLAAALKLLSWAGKDVTSDALAGVIIMTAVVAALALIIGLLSATDTSKALVGAAGITILLVSMTAAITVLSQIVGITNGAVAALAVMTVIVAALAVVVGVLGAIHMEGAFEKAAAVSLLLVAMTAVIFTLSAIGPAAEGAMAGLKVLGVFAVGLVAFVAILGGLCETVSGLEGAISKGLDILVLIAGKLGEAIGAFVGGVLGGLVGGALVSIGVQLSLFAMQVLPFITIMSSVNDSMLSGVTALCGALLAITATDLVSSLMSFLGMGFDPYDLIAKLDALGQGVSAFYNQTQGVDQAKVAVAAQAAQALCTGLAVLPLEGGLFSGSINIDGFKDNAQKLGQALMAFQNEVGELKSNVVNSAIHAGENIIELMSKVPTEGGIASFFTGSQNFSGFAESMGNFGEGISSFNSEVAGITTEGLQPAIDAGNSIIDMVKEIPTEGGITSVLNGSADYTGFSGTMTGLARGISNFSRISQENGGVNLDAVNAAVQGLQTLGQFCKDYLPGFTADGATAFVEAIDQLGDVNVADILTAFDTGQDNAEITGRNFMAALLRGMEAEIEVIIQSCSGLATRISDAINGNQGDFFNVGLYCMGQVSEGMQTGFAGAAETAGELVSRLDRAIDGRSRTAMNDAGTVMMGYLAQGIQNGGSQASSAAGDVVQAALSAVSGYSHQFWQAGSYCAEGFVGGIRSGRYSASIAGASLGSAALSAAKRALDSHSPSKEFYKLGIYSGEGLSNGLDKSETIVTKSASGMANSALDAVSYALSSIGNMNGSSVKIKPVLDFNNLGKYGGSLDFSAAIGGVISSPINNTSKLVAEQMQQSAQIGRKLDKLRKEVSEISKPTYNVGGITYDDGSNVATAVRELTRAVKVERRK